MRSQKKPGVIINIGSAAGLYPMVFDPVYSATKGTLSHIPFSSSLFLGSKFPSQYGEQYAHKSFTA